jgi:hypothetical protein
MDACAEDGGEGESGRLSALVGRQLRYEDESAEVARGRLGKLEPAAGELERTSDTILRFTGTPPLTLEDYFQAFPALLSALHLAQD